MAYITAHRREQGCDAGDEFLTGPAESAMLVLAIS